MDGDLELARVEVDEGVSVPRATLERLLERGEIAPDDLDFRARFALGVTLQLGWAAFEDFGLLMAAYYRRLGNITLLPIYSGFSLETGNVWDRREDISLDSTVLAGSVFLGADTILGPLYIAYGINDSNASTVYLYLGRRWAPD